MASFTCPYCERAAVFPDSSLWQYGAFGGLTGDRYVNLMKCPNPDCGGIVAAAFHEQKADGRPGAVLPYAQVHEPDVLIPTAVRDDLFEARKCASFQAHKATAAMCRRALQGACIDQGADGKKKLYHQIDEVIASNKVHASLKEWADAIRLVGNAGAHPGDDGLDKVTPDEAEDILAFTEEFMAMTYVARERVRQRLAARRATP